MNSKFPNEGSKRDLKSNEISLDVDRDSHFMIKDAKI